MNDGGAIISVILPHYRCERYLREAVVSVLSQEGVAVELWLVDDASPDERWLAEIADLLPDPRLNVLRADRNVGPYRVKNRVLEELHTPLIAFQDADDASHPDRLARQLEHMQRSGAQVVGCGVRYVGEGGEFVGEKRAVDEVNPHLRDGASSLVSHPTMLVQRDVLGALGGFDGTTRIGADSDFVLRASHLARIGNLADPLYDYRIRRDSLTLAEETGFASDLRCRYREGMWERERARRLAAARGQPLPGLRAPRNDVFFDLKQIL